MALTFCVCCLKNEVSKNGQTTHCDNCWNYLMPSTHPAEGLQWGDIWTIICHWHATHDKLDKDYDFCNDVINIAFNQKWRPTK